MPLGVRGPQGELAEVPVPPLWWDEMSSLTEPGGQGALDSWAVVLSRAMGTITVLQGGAQLNGMVSVGP